MHKSKTIKGLVLAGLFFSNVALATTGFLTGERDSGMNKICYYDVLGDTYTLNISSVELCPLTYEF
ncbi:MAG: hypothetical protein WBC60_19340 [Cognaticolwellia sp.]